MTTNNFSVCPYSRNSQSKGWVSAATLVRTPEELHKLAKHFSKRLRRKISHNVPMTNITHSYRDK